MNIGAISGGYVDNSLNSANSTREKVEDGSFESRLKSAFTAKDETELKKACQQFESILLDMMYKEMRATVPQSDLVESDPGRDIFQSMLDDQLVEQASQNSKLGIADAMYKQLSRQMMNQYLPANAQEDSKEQGE